DAEEEVQVPAHDDVDQENVTEEIADELHKVKSSKLRRLKKVGTSQYTQAEIYNIDLDHTSKVLSMQEDTELQEVVKVLNAAKLITEVVTAVATTAASIPIPAAEPAVVAISAAKPAAKPNVLKVVLAAPTVSTRKRKGVVIRDPEEELHDDTPAETLSDKDKAKEEEESHVQAKDVQAKGI
nr:hypothetical protein [Tanacetum cinerariifolium]